MRRLTFYNKYLDPVRDGTKTTTIRKARVVRNLKPGDPMIFAFGSWTAPTLLKARCLHVVPLLRTDNRSVRRRIARADGIDLHTLDLIMADPEPHSLIAFKIVSAGPLPPDAPLFDQPDP